MSLISTKNLVAPLTNMVHMITILLITITFAVLRFSGASISLSSSGSSSTDNIVPQQTIAAPADPGSQLQKNTRPQAPWGQQKSEPNSPSGKKGGLDDIEKALGL